MHFGAIGKFRSLSFSPTPTVADDGALPSDIARMLALGQLQYGTLKRIINRYHDRAEEQSRMSNLQRKAAAQDAALADVFGALAPTAAGETPAAPATVGLDAALARAVQVSGRGPSIDAKANYLVGVDETRGYMYVAVRLDAGVARGAWTSGDAVVYASTAHKSAANGRMARFQAVSRYLALELGIAVRQEPAANVDVPHGNAIETIRELLRP